MHHYSSQQKRRVQEGFSLIELMIAIAIGLFLAAGLTAIFVNNSQSRAETERNNRQLENGRYAMSLLTEDLRLAGFFGEFDPTVLTGPTAVPDPCATSVADLKGAMPLHIQGYDDEAGFAVPSCLSDVRSGTDIVVIRRASTCVAGSADCEAVIEGTPYFQASRCSDTNELASGDVTKFYALDTATSNLNRKKRDCTTKADLRRYRTHIYYIANNTDGSDGVPALKRAELGPDGFNIVPLVEGIENFQLEYGLDTDGNGAPDLYTTQPESGCTGADCVTNWKNVVTVRFSLLARNTEGSPGYSDEKTYVLGVKQDGTAKSVGPFRDNFKRHAYQGLVKLANPAGRRE
ncbi:PilW family protein [Noviherbaspirillum massiliense]|uniref:PilW family protein n=1 Tax=Noviherbaspirillum massiliense TaxID=1465823 RepID=UPI0002D82B04|nr:PilW family protein [Noviherbaspirillum massiliense]